MVSVPTSHLVLFIASLAVAAGVAGAFTTESSRMSATIEDVGVDVSAEVDTDIEVFSDAGSTIYDQDTGEITLAVQNLGGSTLSHDVEQVDVFLDGTFQSAGNLTIALQDASSWAPDEAVEITISAPNLGWGDHRVKVVVDGDSEVFEFSTCAGVDRTRIVFEEADNDELAMMNRSGVIERLGVASKGFSPVAADFDCDGRMEAAFSNGDDDKLYIIDHTGEMEQIGDVKVHDRRIGVADDLDGDGKPEIIFTNRDDGENLYRVEYGGSPEAILDNNDDKIKTAGIGGVADFNGDGDLDIVFLRDNQDVAYLDDGSVTLTGVKAENKEYSIGTPADFDGDGEVRVPIVIQGQKTINLLDSAGNAQELSPLVDDPKGSLATFDWDGDGSLEVVFQHSNDNQRLYYMELTGLHFAITDENGDNVRASDDGVA